MDNFFEDKKVLITGHTGFKGAWLSLVLSLYGSQVSGLSDMSVVSGFYKILKEKNIFSKEFIGDINDKQFLEESFSVENYDLVFHLAAQGIVSQAKNNPHKTITTNILGTYNILNIVNQKLDIKTLVIATTDKVYEDHHLENKEDSKLGGQEFYSASKASSEHIINAFINTEKRNNLNIGIVRAGNVLGGGDYGKDRILTDIINSLNENSKIILRNPDAIRPWQYILDSIFGYLKVAKYSFTQKKDDVFNLNGELNNTYTVEKIVNSFINLWKSDIKVEIGFEKEARFYESKVLTIDSTKAKKILNWETKYNIEEICQSIVEYEKSSNKYSWATNHILKYDEKMKNTN